MLAQVAGGSCGRFGVGVFSHDRERNDHSRWCRVVTLGATHEISKSASTELSNVAGSLRHSSNTFRITKSPYPKILFPA